MCGFLGKEGMKSLYKYFLFERLIHSLLYTSSKIFAYFPVTPEVYAISIFQHMFESCSGHGCVSAYFCVVLSYVLVEALRWTDPPTKESYQMSVDQEVH
jgi:hypothetical protein